MKATKLSSLAVAVSMLSVAAPAVARADVVMFTFEGLAEQSNLTSLVLAAGGLTATLSRPGSAFAIKNESGFQVIGFPASFGTRTLDPFDNPSSAPFILNFSQGITALSIQMGDFTSGDDVDLLTIELFSGLNGTGTSLGLASISLPGLGDFNFLTPSVSTASPALSARFFGGVAGGTNSVYYDNISVTFGAATAVPEPGTLALMASGLIGVGLIRRRKKS